ncbi:uncharacterized protein ASPGLDRAFT_473421 [Aspergillus glaucus CBS 516.65]|uniref:Uncharacterized protein n=1 Tax=Aspergillus glaucus CBS 516.65 TaxID=1160497 RepID=A0A1L9VH71_ASPGL|nr:hypothetical protein ASPGLDRAFT_473421 [Aspergillus glaucus CBS 516.65]OJJ83240.1 hypothetical protein ASPGLDRAFT_473421 [Aspergillus glaucus CBS 516.65]
MLDWVFWLDVVCPSVLRIALGWHSDVTDQKMMICRAYSRSSNVGQRSSGGHTFPVFSLFFFFFFFFSTLISRSPYFSSSARDVPGSDRLNIYRSVLLPENTRVKKRKCRTGQFVRPLRLISRV